MAHATGRIQQRTLTRLRAELSELMRTVQHLRSALALLGWDQETYMPPRAAERRAQHIATLEELVYRELTSSRARRLAERLQQLLPQLPDSDQRMARLFLREFRRVSALPRRLAVELARTRALAVESWRYARKENDFQLFAPYLHQLIELKREQIGHYGYAEHPYDALLELYEPGMRTSTVQNLLEEVAQNMRELLSWVQNRPQPQPFLHPAPCAAQFVLGRAICEAIGFRLDQGRIDYATHPFCTMFGPEDVRITTRCDEEDPRTCLFTFLHELGHALYDQNLPPELADTFAGDGASTAIHESQALLWEDIIGRSLAFCQWAAPLWRRHFNGMLSTPWADLTPELLFRTVNFVQPSLIRTEADEVTYHLHILLRFRLEIALLTEALRVRDIPEAWNAGMEELLGIRPPDDRTGCLQDIHWSLGDFGYFPCYTLGKLYAAMFWKRLQDELPDVEQLIAHGTFEPIVEWLRRNIHSVGALKTPQELLAQIAGKELTIRDFVDYITAKLERVYAEPS
ncbi:MAG: carboxypeptidase M32 [Chlorobiota bacterium]